MGICVSNPDEIGTTEEREKNRKVEKAQRDAKLKEDSAIKILIIGAGGSGKTTLRKQLKQVYDQGFTDDERKDMVPAIITNLIDGAKAVINASTIENVGTALNEESNEAAETITNAESNVPALDENVAHALQKVWADPGFQATFENRTKFQVQECFATFIEELKEYPKWGGPNWIPSIDDCVKARIRSFGVMEDTLHVEGAVFKLFDAGGQRAERRKWIHFFDGVTAVIFVASLTSFNEVLFEDESQNRLVEALNLFDEMVNSKYFKSTPFMLFLNKKDLLIEKLNKGANLNESGLFNDAPKGSDVDEAIDWIKSKFISKKNPNNKNPLYVHVTTAVDREATKAVFEDCRHIVLRNALARAGLQS